MLCGLAVRLLAEFNMDFSNCSVDFVRVDDPGGTVIRVLPADPRRVAILWPQGLGFEVWPRAIEVGFASGVVPGVGVPCVMSITSYGPMVQSEWYYDAQGAAKFDIMVAVRENGYDVFTGKPNQTRKRRFIIKGGVYERVSDAPESINSNG